MSFHSPNRRPRLEPLEGRAVPANHLTVVDTDTSSFNVTSFTGPAGVTTFLTTGAGAELSLADLQAAMKLPGATGVVVSTAADSAANDAGEDGSIEWSYDVAGDLDFHAFGAGKSLTFRTDATATAGDIALTGLDFHGSTADRTDLVFDTSAANGDVRFLADAAGDYSVAAGGFGFRGQIVPSAVNSLTVLVGAGGFVYEDAENAFFATQDAIGIAAGSITLNNVGGEDQFTGGGLDSGAGLALVGESAVTVAADVSVRATDALMVAAPTVTVGSNAFVVGDEVTVTGTAIHLEGASVHGSSSLGLTGGTIHLSGDDVATDLRSTNGSVTLAGSVILSGTTTIDTFSDDGAVTFAGPVDGAGDLVLYAVRITFLDDVGATTPLNALVIDGGLVDLGDRDLTAAQVAVGFEGSGTLAGSGTITGAVTVVGGSSLAPGGVGAVGTLTVVGSVAFDGGALSLDLGAIGDRLAVTGDVTVNADSRLGDDQSTGTLAAPTPVIEFTGTLTGEFANAPLGVSTLVGADAVRVAAYGPGSVVIEPAPAAAGGVVKAADGDGNAYTVRLTGGGDLVAGGAGDPFILVRNAQPSSRLTVTAKGKKGSDGAATLTGGVVVNGPLAAFVGAATDVGRFRVSGAVGSATVRDATTIEFGGGPTDSTRISARNAGPITTGSTLTSLKLGGAGAAVTAPAIGSITAVDLMGDVTAPGGIGSIKATGQFSGVVTAARLGRLAARDVPGAILTIDGDVGPVAATKTFNGMVTSAAGDIASVSMGDGTLTARAPAGEVGSITSRGDLRAEVDAGRVGPVKASGELVGLAPWDVGTELESVTAGTIGDLNVTAGFVGRVRVKANAARHLEGDIFSSTFLSTGNNGVAAGSFGLGLLSADGQVRDSEFTVAAGNVGTVSVGRFIGSVLHVGYTPAGNFNTGGTFAATAFQLASFKATGRTGKDPADPLNWAFANSQVTADKIGSVDLKGVRTDNGGGSFGLKFRSAGGPVKVRSADAEVPSVVLPDAAAVANDFFVLDVV